MARAARRGALLGEPFPGDRAMRARCVWFTCGLVALGASPKGIQQDDENVIRVDGPCLVS